VLICDEPVSALDVSVQAQVINLLAGLQQRLGLAMLFIAHNLAVVRHLSHRVGVMYLGRVVETGPAGQLFDRPAHPYTRTLLSAVPEPDPRQARALPQADEGEPPDPLSPPPGCVFHPRCAHATDLCRRTEPVLAPVGPGQQAACHHPLVSSAVSA
jgi:oligopeptide/dipeptide ABC transporter ATP-binding protein